MKKIFTLNIVFILIPILSFGQTTSLACCDTTKGVYMSTDPVYLKNLQTAGSLDPDLYPKQERINNFDWTLGEAAGSFYIHKPGYTDPYNPTDPTRYMIESPYNDGSFANPVSSGFLWGKDPNNSSNVEFYNKPEDGWELVKRDFGYYYDANGNCTFPQTTDVSNLVTVDHGNPTVAYIILYNKYSSMLRVLGTITGYSSSASQDQEVQVLLSFLGGQNTTWVPSALFNHYSTDGVSQVSQSLDMTTNAASIMSPASKWEGNGHWFFTDIFMGYDFCTCKNPSAINVEFIVNTPSTITLTGTYFGVNEPLTNLSNTNNPITWLGSASGSTSSTDQLIKPQAGMQTYKLLEDLINEYTDEMEQYEKAVQNKEEQEGFIDAVKQITTIVTTVASFAAKKANPEYTGAKIASDPNVDPNYPPDDLKKDELKDQTSAMMDQLDRVKDVVELFSSDISPEKPVMPWISQGEISLGGNIDMTNYVNGGITTLLNPGSSANWDNSGTYPEFMGTCHDITGTTSCDAGSINLNPSYTMYNQAMGNFALVEQPVVVAWGSLGDNKFNFDGNRLKYIFNPAVPVNADETQIEASLEVVLGFSDAQFMQDILAEPRNFDCGFDTAVKVIDEYHFSLMTKNLPLEDIGTITPWINSTYQSNTEGIVTAVYLKLSIIMVFEPDPKYPNKAPHIKTFVVKYPCKLSSDISLCAFNYFTGTAHYTTNCIRGGFTSPVVPATTYSTSKCLYYCDHMEIDGNQAIGDGYKTYFTSDGDITVNGESILSGEFVLVPEYEINRPIHTGMPKRMSYPYRLVDCVNQYQANTYSAGVSGSSSKLSADASNKASFNSYDNIDLHIIPNPATEGTKINYTVPQGDNVHVFITDLVGNKVLDLSNNYQSRGQYQINLPVDKLQAGIYFCTVQTGDKSETKRLSVVK